MCHDSKRNIYEIEIQNLNKGTKYDVHRVRYIQGSIGNGNNNLSPTSDMLVGLCCCIGDNLFCIIVYIIRQVFQDHNVMIPHRRLLLYVSHQIFVSFQDILLMKL